MDNEKKIRKIIQDNLDILQLFLEKVMRLI